MKQPDWRIKKGSRISKLPRPLQVAALVVRNVYQFRSLKSYHHQHDNILTRNNDAFLREPHFQKAYARAVQATGKDFSIPYRVHQALWCSHQAQKVEGDFVELGTGRGFIMSAVLADFEDWVNSKRQLYLFDTFQVEQIDKNGKRIANTIEPHYASSMDSVKKNFSEWPRVNIKQGNVFQTLMTSGLERVALLHLDLNFTDAEVWALQQLWEKIPRGGVVLMDDYAYQGYEKTYNEVNKAGACLGFRVLSTPTGQGIIIK